MACKSCGKRKVNKVDKYKHIMSGYKYLTDSQLKARLEVYKRRFCKDCNSRYECNYEMYDKCKDRLK